MNEVSPDLAAKVLAANTRNVVKKVGDGGTLTSAEAGDFEAATLSPESAREARAQALLVKWATAGRLTKDEEKELDGYHPGIISRGVKAAAESIAAEEKTTPSFTLDPEKKSGSFSDARLAELSVQYGAGLEPRTMRRWIADGRKSGDPCPLEDPVALKAWWARNKKWSVPDWLLRAAAQAPKSEPKPAAEPAPTPGATMPAAAEASPIPGVSLNLDDFELGEGEAVAQQRSLVALLWSELKKAYLTPRAEVDMLQSKYNKATEALRKLEKDDREDRKSRGLLIPRITVRRDIETACELIRQMSETEKRRVLELCPTLNVAERGEVAVAIDRVCEVRTRVFRNLKSLRNTNDALLELAAA